MMKIYLIALLALSATVVKAQEEPNAAPEPYSYGYETDTHSAGEQKDPSGTVTGFYTVQDADGRQRRVEYVADAAGFRAKVQTNEVGTKTSNPADVEVLAAPPNPEQLVYQSAPQQQQIVQVQRQQTIQQVPLTTSSQRIVNQQFLQQPFANYGYNYGSSIGYGYYPGNSYMQRYGSYSYGGYPYGVYGGYGSYPTLGYSTLGTNGGSYYSYNNHLPSEYYRSVQGGYVNGQPLAFQTFGRSGYQTNQLVPVGGATYTTTTSSTSTGNVGQAQTRSGNLAGSSNYIVLKKRESTEQK